MSSTRKGNFKARIHPGHIIDNDVARIVGGAARQKQPADEESDTGPPDHLVEPEPDFMTPTGPVILEWVEPRTTFPSSKTAAQSGQAEIMSML
ncbi:hypothetical protein GOBAR_DD18606 [Gossypium barbadense]|nr:hypothetical protein GOBAR_DD18606 [Gossypium barbadense]